MNVYLNKEGIGDVLIIPIQQNERETTAYRKYGDVTEIYNTETNKVTGYNIFNISNYIELEDGKHQLTEDLLASINNIFDKNGAPNPMEVDLSPKFVVGYVTTKAKHENADKLSVCQVDVGDEQLQIVCGASNIDADQHVVVAKVGAIMPSGLEIKETNLRGVDSFGMICSKKELDLPTSDDEKGIYILTDEVKAGEPFQF